MEAHLSHSITSTVDYFMLELTPLPFRPSLQSSSESVIYSYLEQKEEVLMSGDAQNRYESNQYCLKRDLQSNVKVQMCCRAQSDKYTISCDKLFRDGLSSAIVPVLPTLHTDPEVQYCPRRVQSYTACGTEELYDIEDRNVDLTAVETDIHQDNNFIDTVSEDEISFFSQNEVNIPPTLT